MPVTSGAVCAHLGLVDDRTLVQTTPNVGHRCYAQKPVGAPDVGHQRAYCLSAGHVGCPYYVAPSAAPAVEGPRGGGVRWGVLVPGLAVVVMLVVVGLVYGRDLLGGRRATRPAASGAPASATATVGAGVALAPASATARPAASVVRAVSPVAAGAVRYATPTPEAGGRTVSLSPRAGEAGWWQSGDLRGSHLGDSFLYAGYHEGKVFVSVLRFDVRGLPRGAAVRSAELRLTGLQGERFSVEAGGQWSAQVLSGEGLEDLGRADFQKVFNAASAVTLLPALGAGDLGVRAANSWPFEAAGRSWLEGQITSGAASVLVRVIGPVGGNGNLFAWDSGVGPASVGEGPQLVLSLGPAPATPPALPTQAVVVVVPTATAANVLTAAAYAVEQTRIVVEVGTLTPLPGVLATATPLAGNVATAQVLGYRAGLAPIVIYTPTPANKATATAQAAYATAVAVTTGTFTPVPADAVTPVVVAPTPLPENVMTAAAQSLAATRQAATVGTATAVPYGALIATVTPGPYVLYPSATPGNVLTVVAWGQYATAVAVTTGTFTPYPPGGQTPTATPGPTAVPLVWWDVTPRPSPTATPEYGGLPGELVGKVLFRSDRGGASGGGVYALEVASGRVAWVTQDWPYVLAQQREGLAPDGVRVALVQNDQDGVPQVVVEDAKFRTVRALTSGKGWSYDPAWSPQGERIVYVSAQPGNDEIFTVSPDGGDVRRLTQNNWEWDKHPSWAPDGSQIVFWSNRDSGRRQLWVMNADGSGQHKLLESPYNDWDPIWVK